MKWYILGFVLVLACALHYSISTSNNDYYTEFVFINNPDHILSLPLNVNQMTKKVADKMDCAFACTRSRPWCGSVNFKIQAENDGLHICELLSTDMYTKPSYLKAAQGFAHLSIKNKCMNSSQCQNGGTCFPDYDNDDYHCVCQPAYGGKSCEKVYHDCSMLRSAGYTVDGVYQIRPDGQGSFPVYCDMTTDGGGWTVFQKRNSKSISFNRGWQDYKTGFGDLTGEFWLGLDKIYRLTKRQVTSLRVDLEDLNGNKAHAVYSSFSIADESDFYRLILSGYSGTAGDAITTARYSSWISNNMRFTTPDKDNDAWPGGSCGRDRWGGWWFHWCSISDLNGVNTWWTSTRSFRSTEMKLK